MPISLRRLMAIALSSQTLIVASAFAAPLTGNDAPYRLNPQYRIADSPDTRLQLSSELEAQARADPHPDSGLPANTAATSHGTTEALRQQPYAAEIASAASATALDPALIHAVIYVESRYRHDALSPKGAIGLMQVMPDTAIRYGITDPARSPSDNLKAGTYYLRDLMRMFDQRIDLVLAAYNAGEGAVIQHHWQVPPYRETRNYVLAVMARYAALREVETPLPSESTAHAHAEVHAPARHIHYLAGTRLKLPDD